MHSSRLEKKIWSSHFECARPCLLISLSEYFEAPLGFATWGKFQLQSGKEHWFYSFIITEFMIVNSQRAVVPFLFPFGQLHVEPSVFVQEKGGLMAGIFWKTQKEKSPETVESNLFFCFSNAHQLIFCHACVFLNVILSFSGPKSRQWQWQWRYRGIRKEKHWTRQCKRFGSFAVFIEFFSHK